MIVGLLGSAGCGGTFLDWSLHYLSGKNNYHFVDINYTDRSKIQAHHEAVVVPSPIKGNTAHLHKKTHPNTESLSDVIDIFKSLPVENLHTFYYVDSMKSDQIMTNHNSIIAGHPDVSFITYKFDHRDIDKVFCLQFEKTPVISSNMKKLVLEHSQATELSVWNMRELLSLHYPACVRGQTINEIIVEHKNNFILEFKDMLNNLDKKILEIFEFLDLRVDSLRWESWLDNYHVWKKGNNLEFFRDLDLILHNIVSDVVQDLDVYQMSFAKETVISSKLLYEHNKCLRSYGLEKIPENTRAWHDILEENIYHPLTTQQEKS